MSELHSRYADAVFAARNPEAYALEQQDKIDQIAAFAKGVGTIASGIAASAPAGVAGLATLPFGGVEGAKKVIEDITQALTYIPQDEAGQQMVQRIAGALEVLGKPAQMVSDTVFDATGSAGAATAANIVLDPLNYVAPAAAAAAKPAAKVAGKVAKKAADNLAAPVAPKVGPGAQRGQVGWHGSPHDIQPKPGGVYPEMDITKIGTGEGAQAYGHGVYIAEAQDTAKTYTVRGGESFSVDGKTYAQLQNRDTWGAMPKHERYAITALADSKGNVDEAISNLMDRGMPDSTKAAEVLVNWKAKEKVKQTTGHLYKVDVPDEAVAKMLDWDKPLSQQAPDVKAAIDKSEIAIRDMAFEISGNPDPTGGQLLAAFGKPEEASRVLNELGIPGIKYLDGNSRDAGSGTRNFVIFDDKLIRIIEKNGKPTGLQPWNADKKVGASKTAKEGKK